MMTPQESQALQEFLAQLTQVQGITKDAQASGMIAEAFSRQPDAGYLLVQRTMLQDQALETARSQISRLQAQLQADRETRGATGGGGGFLDPSTAWGNSAAGRTQSGQGGQAMQGGFGGGMVPPNRYQPQAGAPVAQQTAESQGQAAPPPRAGLFGGGGSGFLGSMAATAAGVAGGAFLFQGLGSLMGNHGGGNGLMGQNGHAPVENTTVNNYYGSDADGAKQADGGGNAAPERLLSDDTNSGGDVFGNDNVASNDDFGSADDMSSI